MTKRLFALYILAVTSSLPQIVVIQGSDTLSASRTTINNNFAFLASSKTARWTGSGAPGSIPLSIQGDLYFDTVGFHSYGCYSTVCSSSPNWIRVDGGLTSVVPDTNVTGSLAGTVLTLSWSGTLAKARTLATTVYTDQANMFSTGLQDFSAAVLRSTIGSGVPSTGCTASGNVGKFYTRLDAQAINASVYSCNQIGVGSFAWELVQGGGNTTSGAGTPSGACTPGTLYVNVTPTPNDLYVCGPGATWQRIIATQDNTSGKVCLPGITSGQACITVNDVAGSPNDIKLPTTTGVAGYVLSTDGGTPQQVSWVPNANALIDACASNVGSWEPFGVAPGVSNLAMAANTVYGIELPANSPLCTFTKIVYAVTGPGTGHIAWLVYNATATTLLATASAADANNATLSISFGSPFQFQPNTTYQLLYTADNAADAIKLITNSDSGFMNADSPRSYTCANAASWAAGVVTPPATCGVKTAVNVNIPMIAFHH